MFGGGGWGGKGLERQRRVVGISLNGGRFESFGFFCFAFVFFVFFFVLVFTLGCRFCHERSVFVPFQNMDLF